MSEFVEGNEVVTSASSGVTVEKSFDGDSFAVPAITFDIQSERDESVTVRLSDSVPEDFPMDNVGFHPEFENERWTAYKDHRVQFERTLDPGEQVTTVYGIRLSNRQDAERFLRPPTVEAVGASEEASEVEGDEHAGEHTITDIVSEDSSQVVRDVLSGDGDLPGLGGNEATDATDATEASADPLAADAQSDEDADADPLAVDDPLADPTGESADADADSTDEPVDADVDSLADSTDADASIDSSDVNREPAADDGSAAEDVLVEEDSVLDSEEQADDASVPEQPASPPRPGSVAAALADEIRAGEVTDDDLDTLRQELDVDLPESTNVRIRHLQSRVDDLSAYAEALEEFIDEEGTAQGIIDDFESEVDGLRGELDEMHDDIESAKDEGAQARARVADLEDDLETVESDLDALDALESDLDDVQEELADVDDLEAELADVNERLDAVSDLETLGEQLDDLEDLVAQNTRESSALDDELEDLRDDVDEMTVEADLASLEAEVDDLREEVAEMSHDEQFASLEADLEDLSESLSSAETDLSEDVERVRSDVERVESEVEAIDEWRSELGNVFGN